MLRASILLPLLVVLSTVAGCLAAENYPTAGDVNTLGELAKLTVDNFYQQTFRLRMRYEFAGEFFSQTDRQTLLDAAKKSSAHLGDIVIQLENLQQQMERYSGKDWNQRFGSTGLYEKTASELSGAALSRFGIDYYIVLCAGDKKTQAQELLKRIDAFASAQNPSYLQLVKGRVLVLLCRDDPNHTPAAKRILTELSTRPDANQRLVFLAAIEGLRLESAQANTQAEHLARDVLNSTLSGDLEIVLPLAFIERRLGNVDAYNNLLQASPAAQTIAAQITLAWLESGGAPTCMLDAPLAAEAALNNDPPSHRQLLCKLAQDNASASPVVDYAAAVAVADSNEQQAAYLLTRASQLLDEQSAAILRMSDKEIAAQAARLAYRAFVREPSDCAAASAVFENYFGLAGKAIDPNLQYFYTQVLTLCGRTQQAIDILRKIPPQAEVLYPKAQLDLISASVASDSNASAFDLAAYVTAFSRYLRGYDDCVYLEPATELLKKCLGEIELLEIDGKAYASTIRHGKKIARFLYDCTRDQTRACLVAEFVALDPNASAEELTAAERLLTDANETSGGIDALRARARLAARKRDSISAAQLWEQVAQQNTDARAAARSWQWWRAKYYQLQSAAGVPDSRPEVLHAIDVLTATYKDIPQPWAAKLEALANKCR